LSEPLIFGDTGPPLRHDCQVELASEDLRIDVIRTVGDGPCAVRITHMPTGRSVTVHDQPTTEDNKERAMDLLRESFGPDSTS
jgi:protein subunit release factor A